MTSDDIKNASNDTAKRVGEAAEGVRSAAKDAAAKAGDTARDYAARAQDAASDAYGRAQDRVRDAADRLPDSASDAIAAGQRAYSRGSDAVGRHVAKQPIEALLLAGAIGYLVGWAANRG